MKVIKPSVELLWITPEAEKQIEVAGRTCYKSENKITEDSAGKFAEQMRKRGHHAMIEHAVASFRIVTDRGITHEIVRHRLASYAQESTRYCNYSGEKFGKECSFIEPPGLTITQRDTWSVSCCQAETNYFIMLDHGCSPQIARSVLPNCLKTEIVMMANFREWRHFIKLRGSKAAHPQIRPIARAIWEILVEHAPSIYGDLDTEEHHKEEDYVGEFLDASCVKESGAKVGATPLYDGFVIWFREVVNSKIRFTPSQKMFGTRLKDREEFRVESSNGKIIYHDLRLNAKYAR